MRPYFFDTSALKHRYISTAASPRIRKITSDKRHQLYVSELTIVELASAFADDCIKRRTGQAQYDRLYNRFFGDIASGRIQIRSVTQRNYENARHLLRFAKFIEKRHLKGSDAIIAESCRELAYDLNARVAFYSADRKLFNTLRSLSAYSRVVKLRLVTY